MFAYDVVELFPDIISVFREQLRHTKGTWRAAAVQHLMAEELSDIGVRRDAEHAAADVVHIYQMMVFGIADVDAIGVIVQQPEGTIFKKVSRTVIHYKNVLHRADAGQISSRYVNYTLHAAITKIVRGVNIEFISVGGQADRWRVRTKATAVVI